MVSLRACSTIVSKCMYSSQQGVVPTKVVPSYFAQSGRRISFGLVDWFVSVYYSPARRSVLSRQFQLERSLKRSSLAAI